MKPLVHLLEMSAADRSKKGSRHDRSNSFSGFAGACVQSAHQVQSRWQAAHHPYAVFNLRIVTVVLRRERTAAAQIDLITKKSERSSQSARNVILDECTLHRSCAANPAGHRRQSRIVQIASQPGGTLPRYVHEVQFGEIVNRAPQNFTVMISGKAHLRVNFNSRVEHLPHLCSDVGSRLSMPSM